MTISDILLGQLTDVFRIGMIVALVYTAGRTAGVAGFLAPVSLGLVFVAVIIPMTMQQATGPDLWRAIGVGLLANAIILAIVMALRAAVLRWRG